MTTLLENLPQIAVYWIVLAALIVLEHITLARRWRDYELARRTLGITTVMAAALPLALTGIIDLATWTVLFCGFGIAGAITGALYTSRWAKNRAQRNQIIKNRIAAHTDQFSSAGERTDDSNQKKSTPIRH